MINGGVLEGIQRHSARSYNDNNNMSSYKENIFFNSLMIKWLCNNIMIFFIILIPR